MATDESAVIGSKFVDFLSISSTLAGFGDGSGHLKLMEAVIIWLQVWYVIIHFLFFCRKWSIVKTNVEFSWTLTMIDMQCFGAKVKQLT